MGQAGAKGHPNVLLIVADHWPAALLGAAGHPAIQTPTLDRTGRATRGPTANRPCAGRRGAA
jgi:arylsulfatase A-like enzyme